MHEPRFVDLAPAQVYATLLDEDRYLCSERTFYRVLAENAEVRERRDQLRRRSCGTQSGQRICSSRQCGGCKVFGRGRRVRRSVTNDSIGQTRN